MYLLVPNKYGYSFAEQIKKVFIARLKIKFNVRKTIAINIALIDEYNLNQNISIEEIFDYMYDHIVIKPFGSYYKIQIDPNIRMYGTSVKLVTLVKFITYGNLNQKGYRVILDVIKDLRKEIDEIISEE